MPANPPLHAGDHLERRVCAILAADIAGYSRLMEADEEDTHRRLMRLRFEHVEPGVARWHGQIVKHTGDGFLAIFDNLLEAVGCAVALQKSLIAEGADSAEDKRLSFRMGLNISDTIIEPDDIYGEGVNIAARLQAYAEPGGIVMSAEVAEQLASRVELRCVDLGDLHLKNINRPIRAFALQLAAAPPAGRPVSGPRPDLRPSIAVLPFRKPVAGGEEGYFADGIVDDIIRMLSGLKDLLVIARGSTLGYGDTRADARTVGRELGVRYVLSGGVARAGGRIRITTELGDGHSGAILWAERYEGDISQLFELQDRISLRVVATLAPHIREQELKRAMRKHPDSMDAYDLVLQAIDLLYRMDYRAFSGARGLLQQARVLDGDYAPAWAYAAQWHTFRIGQGWSSDMQADMNEAARLAAAAVERDKHDAAALAICGHTNGFLLHDYDTARALLDRALELSPSSALAWTLGSCGMSYIGEGREAVSRAETSLRLSPLDPLAFFYLCNLGIAHYANADYEQAVQVGRASAAHKKTFRANLRTLAASLVAIGRTDEARAAGAMLMEIDPTFRLSRYRQLCPWRAAETRNLFLERLREAGLPE